MNSDEFRTHGHEPNGHDGTTGVMPVHIAVWLAGCDEQYREAATLPHRTDVESAVRAGRLALVCARRAGWWGLLARHTYHAGEVHHLYGRAALIARRTERDQARFWRDTATEYRARADGRPTSDAAGGLSNWHELGVSV